MTTSLQSANSKPKEFQALTQENAPIQKAKLHSVLDRITSGKSEEQEKTFKEKSLYEKVVYVITWIPSKFVQLVKRAFAGLFSSEEKEASPSSKVSISSNPLLNRFSFEKPKAIENAQQPKDLKGKVADKVKQFGHFISEKAGKLYEETKCTLDGSHHDHYFHEGAQIAAGKGIYTQEQLAKLSPEDHLALIEGMFFFEGLREENEAQAHQKTLGDDKFVSLYNEVKKGNVCIQEHAKADDINRFKDAFNFGKLLAKEVEILLCNKGKPDQYYQIDLSKSSTELSPALRKELMDRECKKDHFLKLDSMDLISDLKKKYVNKQDSSKDLSRSLNEAKRFAQISEEKGERRQKKMAEFARDLAKAKSKEYGDSWATFDALNNSDIASDDKLPSAYVEELKTNTNARTAFASTLAQQGINVEALPQELQKRVEVLYKKEEKKVETLLDNFTAAAHNGVNLFNEEARLNEKQKEIQAYIKAHPEMGQEAACNYLSSQVLQGNANFLYSNIATLATSLGLTSEQASAVVDSLVALKNSPTVFTFKDNKFSIATKDDLKSYANSKELAESASQHAKIVIEEQVFNLAACGVTTKMFNFAKFLTDPKLIQEATIKSGEAFRDGFKNKANSSTKDAVTFETGRNLYLAKLASKEAQAIRSATTKKADLEAQKAAITGTGPSFDRQRSELDTKIKEQEKIINRSSKTADDFTDLSKELFVKAITTSSKLLGYTRIVRETAQELGMGDVNELHRQKMIEKTTLENLGQAFGNDPKKKNHTALITAAEKMGQALKTDVKHLFESDPFVSALRNSFGSDAKKVFFALKRGALYALVTEKADALDQNYNTKAWKDDFSNQLKADLNVQNQFKIDTPNWQTLQQNNQLQVAFNTYVAKLAAKKIDETIINELGFSQEQFIELGRYEILALEKQDSNKKTKESALHRVVFNHHKADYEIGLYQARALDIASHTDHGKEVTKNNLFDTKIVTAQEVYNGTPDNYKALVAPAVRYAEFVRGEFNQLPRTTTGLKQFSDLLVNAQEEQFFDKSIAQFIAHKEKQAQGRGFDCRTQMSLYEKALEANAAKKAAIAAGTAVTEPAQVVASVVDDAINAKQEETNALQFLAGQAKREEARVHPVIEQTVGTFAGILSGIGSFLQDKLENFAYEAKIENQKEAKAKKEDDHKRWFMEFVLKGVPVWADEEDQAAWVNTYVQADRRELIKAKIKDVASFMRNPENQGAFRAAAFEGLHRFFLSRTAQMTFAKEDLSRKSFDELVEIGNAARNRFGLGLAHDDAEVNTLIEGYKNRFGKFIGKFTEVDNDYGKLKLAPEFALPQNTGEVLSRSGIDININLLQKGATVAQLSTIMDKLQRVWPAFDFVEAARHTAVPMEAIPGWSALGQYTDGSWFKFYEFFAIQQNVNFFDPASVSQAKTYYAHNPEVMGVFDRLLDKLTRNPEAIRDTRLAFLRNEFALMQRRADGENRWYPFGTLMTQENLHIEARFGLTEALVRSQFPAPSGIPRDDEGQIAQVTNDNDVDFYFYFTKKFGASFLNQTDPNHREVQEWIAHDYPPAVLNAFNEINTRALNPTNATRFRKGVVQLLGEALQEANRDAEQDALTSHRHILTNLNAVTRQYRRIYVGEDKLAERLGINFERVASFWKYPPSIHNFTDRELFNWFVDHKANFLDRNKTTEYLEFLHANQFSPNLIAAFERCKAFANNLNNLQTIKEEGRTRIMNEFFPSIAASYNRPYEAGDIADISRRVKENFSYAAYDLSEADVGNLVEHLTQEA